ncbi:uncharacterized protein L969DRAFT_67197 [Mixia osmundae IAM 14324]|uniref:DNA polymerase V n=1 Tax=Mixia osmundae (strain CBS 9802 / IAM 14324 / JCM 22182 / KY 12970) TaxID=764103 RepID=G7E1K9_MIXOS|nr:uncharacterized protein L969DRAFT_67197 [Mixia osmundae IAM 14324]KEI36671.1 hypothetical protein L969DRAFT_67197 [Mixia osmundae IAM 14324]GAA96719.1 hypothetical protein E5Q_03390 [Mixia osmundae IAM 14324]
MSAAVVAGFSAGLWSNIGSERVAAADKLVTALRPQASGSNETLDSDLEYALKRLIRGLASPRDSSRVGYSVALTELLVSLPGRTAEGTRAAPLLTLEGVLNLLLETTSGVQKGANATRTVSDERELQFARLFGIHAILRSGALLSSHSQASGHYSQLIRELYDLLDKRLWLTDSVTWIIVESVLALRDAYRRGECPWIAQALDAVISTTLTRSQPGKASKAAKPAFTETDLAIALAIEAALAVSNSLEVEATFHEYLGAHLPRPQAILSKPNVAKLTTVLSTVNPTDMEGARLHIVWHGLLSCAYDAGPNAKTSTSANARSDIFLLLVHAVVEGTLSQPTASMFQRHTGVLIMLYILSSDRIPAQQRLHVFSKAVDFARMLTMNLKRKDRIFNKLCHQIIAALSSIAKTSAATAYDMLSVATESPIGSIAFDITTHTKLVDGVLGSIEINQASQFLGKLKELLAHPLASSLLPAHERHVAPADAATMDEEDLSRNAKAIEHARRLALDHMGALVRKHVKPTLGNSDTGAQDMLATEAITICLALGFFKASSCDPPLSEDTQAAARQRFFGVLADIRPARPDADFVDPLEQALRALDRMEGGSDGELLAASTPGFAVHRQTAGKLLKRVQKSKTSEARAVETLVRAVTLALYDDPESAGQSIETLSQCVEGMFPKKSKRDALVVEEAEEEGEEAEPSTILLDLVIDLLQAPSAFLRSICESTFAAFANKLGVQGVQLLIDQLDPEGDVEGEEIDSDQASNSSDSDSASDGEEDEDEEDDEEGIEGVELSLLDEDVDLRDKVAKALASSGLAPRDGDSDADSSSGEEEVDDASMAKLDEQLAEIFRFKRDAKKGQKELERNEQYAKVRVLDLVATYCKTAGGKVPASLAVAILATAKPRKSVLPEATRKAVAILRIISNRSGILLGEQTAHQLLERVHSLARRPPTPEYAELCSLASIFVVSSACTSEITQLGEVFAASVKDYATRKTSQFPFSLIMTACRRSNAAMWQARQSLLDSSNAAVNAHRRLELLAAAQSLLASHRKETIKDAASRSSLSSDATSYLAASIAAIQTYVRDSLAAEGTINAAKLRDALKIGLQLARLSASVTVNAWSVADLQELLNDLASSDRFKNTKSLHTLAKQLLAIVSKSATPSASPAVPAGKKRAKTEDDSETPVKKASVKRKRVNGNA